MMHRGEAESELDRESCLRPTANDKRPAVVQIRVVPE
jgi:hypothetical protein